MRSNGRIFKKLQKYPMFIFVSLNDSPGVKNKENMSSVGSLLIEHLCDLSNFWQPVSSNKHRLRGLTGSRSVPDLSRLSRLDVDRRCCVCAAVELGYGGESYTLVPCGHRRCGTCSRLGHSCTLCTETAGGVQKRTAQVLLTDGGDHLSSARAASVCTRLVPQRTRLKTNGHFSDMMQKFDRRFSLGDGGNGSCRGSSVDGSRPRTSLWSTLRRDRRPGHPPLPPGAVKNTDGVTDKVKMSPRFPALRRRQRTSVNQSVLTDGSSDSGDDGAIYSRLHLLKQENGHGLTAGRRGSYQLQVPASETPVGNRLQSLHTSADSAESPACHSRGHSCSSLMSMSLADSACSVSRMTNHSPSPSDHVGTLDDLYAMPPSQRGHIVRRSARCTRNSPYRASRFSRAPAPAESLTSVLKPIYFEVPQARSRDFLGRQQLFEQLSRQLAVQLQQPGEALSGCLLTGCAGSGKTAVVLHLVQLSCFGQLPASRDQGSTHAETTSAESMDGVSHHRNVSYANVSSTEGGSVPPEVGRVSYGNRSSIEGGSVPLDVGGVSEHARVLASRVVAYHFCQVGNAVSVSVPEFVHSLAAQLCQAPQLAVFSCNVQTSCRLRQLLSRDSCWRQPRAALLEGVLQSLEGLWRQGRLDGRLCLILVDGLVDADHTDDCDDLVTFLSECLADFPPWLKLVATSDGSNQAALRQLPLHQVCLDTNAQADLSEFIGARVANSPVPLTAAQVGGGIGLPGGNRSRFVDHLTRLSAGSYFFADQCLQLLEEGQLVIKASSFGVLPRTIHQLLQLVFSLRFRTQLAFDAVRPILACCLASPCPLSAHQLFQCVSTAAGVHEPLVAWQRFLQRLRALADILVCRSDGTYMLVHDIVRDWLLQPRSEGRGGERHRFCVDVQVGHSLLALNLARLGVRPLSGDDALSLVQLVSSGSLHLFPQVEGTASGCVSDVPRSLCGMWLSWVLSPAEATAALVCRRHVHRPQLLATSLLLAAAADPNRPTAAQHASPLLSVVACQQQHPQQQQLLRLLLRWPGIDVNNVNARGQSALQLAASAGQLDGCRQLVASGARLDLCDSAGRCARVSAALGGHLRVLDLLLEAGVHSGAGHVPRQLFQSIVVASSGGGQEHVLLHLLQQQCRLLPSVSTSVVDSVDARLSGETALTMAASAGHTRLCCALLDRCGASIAAANRHGASPLMSAARHGRGAVCTELLRRRGVYVDARDAAGRSALMVAACGGYWRVVRQLLHAGASVDLCDNDGLTALCWASLKSQRSCVLALLDEKIPGAAVNHTDNSGRTPLDLAVFSDSAPLVELLLDRGACVERCDGRGVRTLDRAVACASVEVVQCFLRRGAKLTSTTWKAAQNKPEILYALLAKLNEDGMLLFRRERIEQAAHRFSHGLNRFPEQEVQQPKLQQLFRQLHANLLLNLSRCQRRMGYLKKSEDLATQAMTLVPDAFEPYFFRAKALHAQRRMDAALRDIDRAIRLCPTQSNHRQLHSTLLHVREQLLSAAVGSGGSCGDHSSADSAVYSCVE